MDDQAIIALLFQRSESGLEQLDIQYKRLSQGIMAGVLDNHADVEECYNDLLMKVWKSIPPDAPRSLTAYISTLSRNIAINKYRYNNRQKRKGPYEVLLSELGEAIPDTEGLAESLAESENQRITEVLNRFVTTLDPETRVLFVRRYVYFEAVRDLGERFCLSENTVSARLYRARNKLKKMLKEEDIEI